jgi:hypothetical protein
LLSQCRLTHADGNHDNLIDRSDLAALARPRVDAAAPHRIAAIRRLRRRNYSSGSDHRWVGLVVFVFEVFFIQTGRRRYRRGSTVRGALPSV